MSDLDYSSNLSCSAVFNSSAIMKFTSDYLNIIGNSLKLDKPEAIPTPKQNSPTPSSLNKRSSRESRNPSEKFKRSQTESRFSIRPRDLTPSYKTRNQKTPSILSIQNEDIPLYKIVGNKNHNINSKTRRSNRVVPDSSLQNQDLSSVKQHTKSTPLVFGKNPFSSLVQSHSSKPCSPLQVVQAPISMPQSVNISSDSRKTPAFGLSLLSNSSERKTPCFGISSLNQISHDLNSIMSDQSEGSLRVPETKKKQNEILETHQESQESEEVIRSSIKDWLSRHQEMFEKASCWCFVKSDRPLEMIEGLKSEKEYRELKRLIIEAIEKKFGVDIPDGRYNLLDLCLVYEVLSEREGEVKDVYKRVSDSSRKRLAEIRKKKFGCFEEGIEWLFELVQKDLMEEN